MIILDRKPVTLAEVKSLANNLEEKKDLSDYLKKFGKLDLKEAEKLKEEINALNNPKIREEKIIKIVDLLPKNSEDVNKIFNDVSLSEEETNALLNILNNY